MLLTKVDQTNNWKRSQNPSGCDTIYYIGWCNSISTFSSYRVVLIKRLLMCFCSEKVTVCSSPHTDARVCTHTHTHANISNTSLHQCITTHGFNVSMRWTIWSFSFPKIICYIFDFILTSQSLVYQFMFISLFL